jgi:phosphoglycerol transferase MdoB-like AlkP superfamily enzyme
VRQGSKRFTGNYYSIILYRLFLALVAFWLSRLFFYVFNTSYFSHLNFSEVLNILFFGMRFDISALIMFNSPFIILMALPLPFRNYSWYRWAVGFVFYLANFIGLAANFIDVIYFRFTQKRMTADIFTYAENEGGFLNLLPQFLRDFWYMFLILFICFAGLVYFARKLKFTKRKRFQGNITFYGLQTAAFLLTGFLMVTGIRGGFQLKPINIITAGQYTQAQNTSLLLNTPFTIIKTVDQQALQPVKYFSDFEADLLFNPVHLYEFAPNDSIAPKKNVVVIIMESMSSEHIGAFNKHIPGYLGFTPFIDSLIELDECLAINGFANGKRSIEGIPAVVAGIPSLMNRPYIISSYAANKINSLANLLGPLGYQTSFFHGGTNGTMDFDGFAMMAGYDNYFGRTEYNDETDFDGNWGIFDEPFFQYTAQNLDATEEPFFATLFSLSAHHPYTIPNQYKGKFRKGKLEIQEAVMYADYALKRFFETASQMDWYHNTLFIITADHTSEPFIDEYKTRVGVYRIPLIFYAPQGSTSGKKNIAASQADILPSVLHLLDYDKPFVAFGNSIFDDSTGHFAVNYLNGIYQISDEELILQFDGSKSMALYNYRDDKLLEKNLLEIYPDKAVSLENKLKAYIQQYNNRLIENRLTAD